jgi:hypothetical protein
MGVIKFEGSALRRGGPCARPHCRRLRPTGRPQGPPLRRRCLRRPFRSETFLIMRAGQHAPKHEVLLDDLRIRPDPVSGIDELAAVNSGRALLPSSSASRAVTLWQAKDNRSRHPTTAPPRIRHFSGLIWVAGDHRGNRGEKFKSWLNLRLWKPVND